VSPENAEENPKPVKQEEDLDTKIKRHVKGLLDEIETGRYIECSGCGDKILRKNGTCKRCHLKFDKSKGTWEQELPTQTNDDETVRW
jgi:DNA-directed RNA polymerase subunit RPC12/RpoP